uniref:Ig-like domain-containing protein n=1 Tax=Denticeps clupeoides TaxID=299321 RepID=A0AAY4CL61_9TELE
SACLTDISSWMAAHELNPTKPELIFIPADTFTTSGSCYLPGQLAALSFCNSPQPWGNNRQPTLLLDSHQQPFPLVRSNEEGRGYVNRTRLLLNNEGGRCSLLLRRVSVADEGTYVCYVLSTGERIVKKQETVLRYTVTVECRHGNSCTCNASGGYPEANVSWWQDGRRLENQSLMTSQRHEDSKLIDLFSTLTVHSNSKCVRSVLQHMGPWRKLKLQGKFPRLLWFVCEPYLAQMASTESRSTSLLCP